MRLLALVVVELREVEVVVTELIIAFLRGLESEMRELRQIGPHYLL